MVAQADIIPTASAIICGWSFPRASPRAALDKNAKNCFILIYSYQLTLPTYTPLLFFINT